MKKHITCLTLILMTFIAHGQQSQNIRGRIFDADNDQPLFGATIILVDSDPVQATSSDFDGNYALNDVPVGRCAIRITCVGYEPRTISGLELNSAKELLLDIPMNESIAQLQAVKIEGKKSKRKGTDEMALVSSRGLSVEEGQRYAGTFGDPARMASNFAGVVSNAEGDNSLVIRGNSPRGILWRIEGMESPNPNHFADEGSTGGPINALNGKVLDHSGFLTGAFAPEYGNALSGVFDVRLRKGNNQQREYAFGFGVLGVDFTAEGPFSSQYQGSYLFNYRYSSLALLDDVGVVDFGGVPKYQDMVFKLNLPSEKLGTFEVYGLGGMSNISEEVVPNEETTDFYKDDYYAYFGVFGLNHNYHLSDKSYVKTSLSASSNGSGYKYYEGLSENNYQMEDDDLLSKTALRGQVQFHHKMNARNKFILGATGSSMAYDFSLEQVNDQDQWEQIMKTNGRGELAQIFGNWKHRLNEEITLVTGVHTMYYTNNQTYSIEPRLSANWQLSEKNAVFIGYGKHSKTESLLNYASEVINEEGLRTTPNTGLQLPKAHHVVLGGSHYFNPYTNLKLETYYQHLYDVPVAVDPNSYFSTINQTDWFVDVPLHNKGLGRNYGLEATLERYHQDDFFYLFTGSLYKSEFKNPGKAWKNTRFDANYAFNALMGKDFHYESKNHPKTLGVSLKGTLVGGNRYTPVQLEESILAGHSVRNFQDPFSKKGEDVFFINLAVNYKVNLDKYTHSLKVEFINLTNQQSRVQDFYNPETQSIEYSYQLAMIPNLMYTFMF